MTKTDLTAKNLKNTLWDTIVDLREKKIDPGYADAIASQAREVVRIVREQRMIANSAGIGMPDEVIEFAGAKKA